MESRPRLVRATITRVVKELAMVELERDGSIREYVELIEELEDEVVEVHSVQSVITAW